MKWEPSLSSRIGKLPNLLAGPLLRKVTNDSVTVWFAFKRKASVTLTVYDDKGTRLFSGKRDTLAVGANLHIVAVTAQRDADKAEQPLHDNAIYMYDAAFSYPASSTTALPNLPAATEDKIAIAAPNTRLTYASYGRPSFCLPSSNINLLRILHGSCRKAAGDGPDLLAEVDSLIAEKPTDPLLRPQQLLLTGDQIYADDVPATLLIMLTDAATVLLGRDEMFPTVPPFFASALPPFARRAILDSSGFTSVDLDSHLMSLGEYLCMYLFVWSSVLWPAADKDLPNAGTVLLMADAFLPHVEEHSTRARKQQERLAAITDSIVEDHKRLLTLRASLPNVRCALANIPSYMVFDDHEITDDWNMTFDIATKMYANPLARRVMQNGLVAYVLCQHWGNAPEQFPENTRAVPGGSLFFYLNGRSGAEYESNSDTIAAIVGMPTSDSLRLDKKLLHPIDSLTYNYTIEGDAHQVIVTDTRSWRSYPDGGGEAPELLTSTQFVQQIANTPALRKNGVDRQLIVVLSTNAPPVQSIRSATEHDWIANHLRHYPDIHEAWDMPSRALDRLIKALADKVPFNAAKSSKIVLLSGDVHIGFAARLHYRAKHRLGDTDAHPANVVIAQLVASSFKKQTDETIDLQRQGYEYSPHWYTHPLIADHVTEYYIGWNQEPSGQLMGTWFARAIRLDGASSFYLKPLKQPPAVGNIGSALPVFIAQPPDFSYQLDYVEINGGGKSPTGLRPLPPLPASGATEDERKEAAHAIQLAMTNYRLYNKDSGVVRHIIGVNNFGDLSFTFPANDAPALVRHRLHFRTPDGQALFAEYAVNLETVDPAHPTSPAGMQVTP